MFPVPSHCDLNLTTCRVPDCGRTFSNIVPTANRQKHERDSHRYTVYSNRWNNIRNVIRVLMKSPQQMHLIQGSKEVLLYCSLETIRRLFSLQPFILSWNHMDSQLWVLVRTSIACLILCLEACTIFLFSPSLD